ncbi:MAG: aminotransferase [Myxococcota bacterium]|nr:aminotransferase [Myxococcota bacterium]
MAPSLEEIDLRSLLHPWTSISEHAKVGPLVMHEGHGARLRDTQGREYIDGLAGLWCVDIGYGRSEVADALAQQSRQLPYYHSFSSMTNQPSIELADRLQQLAPWPIARVFFGLSGSDANDTQFKLAWLYHKLRGAPAKRKIISHERGYHGVTIAAASATGLPSAHAAFGLPLDGFLHVRPPYPYREMKAGQSEEAFVAELADELDAAIVREGPETVAAFIAEPVMGAGGVIVPPEGYFPAIKAVLEQHDVLMIADEVICGFGRLGRPFGSQAVGIEPDLVTLAKGLTSGYAPLSACLLTQRVWEVLEREAETLGVFGHGFTYSGHPLCAAAGLANLDLMKNEALFERAAKLGVHLQARLNELFADHPHVGDVRGMGLIGAIEMVRDRDTKEAFAADEKLGPRVFRRLLERGVIIRAIGDCLAFCPPYVIEVEDLDTVLERTREVLDELTP